MSARRRVRGAVLLGALVVLALLATACAGESADDAADEDAESTTSTVAVVDPTEEYAAMTPAELTAEAYVAGYPLVVTTRTLQRLGGLLGVNQLVWQSTLSGPASRVIVAPNRDTLYSIAVLDLRSEPMVLTVPAIDDRYYAYQLLDAWTESFDYIGTRATDGQAGSYAITPPGWEGELPDGVAQIESPTNQVFLLGRFLVDDDADIPAVLARRDEVRLEPLSARTGEDEPAPPPPPLGSPAGTAQDIPADATFFDELGAALAVNPPTTPRQRALFDEAAAHGIGADQRPSESGDPALIAILDEGAAAGHERITGAASAQRPGAGGWGARRDVGRYGDDLLLRALVARIGWGANVPEEAVYPLTRVDAEGAPLDGSRTYRLRFPPGELPPVDAFWSLSAYGADMFFAEHPSGRYTIGDRTPGLELGADGSLELTLSHDEPAPAPDGAPVNWLPVPSGPFVLMLRLYLPQAEVLDGTYEYPVVEPVD
jgi:hypothetical protein